MSRLRKPREQREPKTPAHGWRLAGDIAKAITAIAVATAAILKQL